MTPIKPLHSSPLTFAHLALGASFALLTIVVLGLL